MLLKNLKGHFLGVALNVRHAHSSLKGLDARVRISEVAACHLRRLAFGGILSTCPDH